MISSAVVIPETTIDQNQSQPPSLKRKFSPPPERDGKRLRVDTENSPNGSQAKTVEPSSAVSIPGKTSPQNRRRSSALGVEEKKRNQRLFGTLLGTLSQATTSTKPAHRKRDEIEARQRERLKRQNEEQEEERSRQRERIHERRLRDQQSWDKEGMHIRHRNMRATAGFLLTKTEPRLYFLPWELRDEEEEAIRRQKEDVEARIRRELGGQERGSQETPSDSRNGNGDGETSDHARDESMTDGDMNGDDKTQRDNALKEQDQQADEDTLVGDDNSSQTAAKDEHKLVQRNGEHEDRHKDDDHHGEELVEGQEDDVIY